jgi:hypothetical protein
MPIETPELDDLRYSRVVEELVRRIPVYAPEWTNHNDADPGIALLQLFAYLTEQVGYRLNRVPDKARVELLKLLGVRLAPARAATSQVAFFLAKPAATLGFVIEAGSAVTRRTDTTVTYETDVALDVVPAEVAVWLSTKNPFLWDLLRLDEAGSAEPSPTDAELPPKVPTPDCAWLTLGWDGKRPRAADLPLEPAPLLPPSGGGVAHPWLWIGLQLNDRRDAGFLGVEVTLHVVLDDDEAPTATADVVCGPVLAPGEPAPAPITWLSYVDGETGTVRPIPGRIVDETDQLRRSGTIRFTVPFTLGAPTAWADLREAVVPAPLDACFQLGDVLKSALPSSGTIDVTGFHAALATALSAAQPVVVPPKPAVGHPLDPKHRDPGTVRGWLRIGPLPADRGAHRVRHLGFNVVGVTQARTVENRVLGTSDGRPGQTLRLPHGDVLPGTLALAVQESAAPDALLTTWAEVDSLDAAGPFDRVYALDAEAGVVTFGDGERGMIPPLVPRAGAVVALRFRHGGGLAGECAAGAIDQTAVQATGLQGVVNVVPARGGADAEDLLQAELRARKELSTRHRAVTADDFAWIALQTPTVRVGRAIVAPLRRPLCAACPEPAASAPPAAPPSSCVPCLPAAPDTRFAPLPGAGVGTSPCGLALPAVAGLDEVFEAPGVVSVVIVPDAPSDPPPPGTELLPTPSMLRAVCGWLDQHRLVTTEVHVVPPQYCRLCDVYVRVRPRPGYSRVRLQELVLDSLATWLDVLVGGPDGEGAAFGGQLHVADLIARVFRTEGVDGVEELTASFARTRSQASPRTGRLVRCAAQAGDVDRIALAADEVTSLDPTSFTLATV